MHTLASYKVIYFPQERNIQLGYLFKKAPQRQRTQIFATHQDQNASFLPKLYTTIQLKQRLENTHYYPMSPSYLASQPGGKGWFCHGWNCVQAFAIFDFTSDKNKNNASVASCHQFQISLVMLASFSLKTVRILEHWINIPLYFSRQ